MTKLIDADKLIKKFLDRCRTEFEIKNKCMEDENVLALIQNAPTVEYPFYQEAYQTGYEEGYKKGREDASSTYELNAFLKK